MNSRPHERVSFSKRFRKVVLECLKLLAIALAALLLIAFVVFVSVKTGIAIPIRWFGLCAWTGLLIWFVSHQCKHHRRSTKFWLAFGGLLTIHLIVFVGVLQTITDWGLGWFSPVFLVEAPVMVLLLERFSRQKSPQ